MTTLDLSSEILDVIPQTMRVIREDMRGIAQPELTVPQFRILARLDIAPHTNKQLADWIGITAPSMCRTVNLLVNHGYVSRQPTEEDGREIRLTLSSKGKKKYGTIKQATRRMLKEKLAILSVRDQEELRVGLSLIRKIFLE